VKFACQYSIIQFMPYAETREFANVGVVLLCHERGYFGFKLLKRYGRVTRFFESMDRRIYLAGKAVLHEELTRLRGMLKGFDLDLRRRNRDPVDAMRLFVELTRRREAIFRFDQPGVIMADDPKSACDELYGYFVERDFVTKEYQERQLEREVRKLLVLADLSDRFEEHTLGDDDYHARFPFVSMHGERPVRVIKPLYLAQDEPNRIYAHADVWIPKIKRLRAKHMLPEAVMFPLTSPQRSDAKRIKAFNEVESELGYLGVLTASSTDSQRIVEFARG
jgi:hypothetical protein